MDWAGPGVAVVISVAGWVHGRLEASKERARQSALIDQRIADLTESEKLMSQDLKEAASELRSVATQMKVSGAEQSVINKMSLNTLQSLAQKVEAHDRLLAEHGAVLRGLK